MKHVGFYIRSVPSFHVWLKAIKFCGSLWNWTNFTSSGRYCRKFREKRVIMEKEEPGSCMSLTDSAQVPNPLKSYWCLFSTFSSWRSYVCYDYRNYHSAITCWVSLVMHKTEIHMLPCLTLCNRYVCWSAADRYVCWSFWNHKLCTSVAKYYNTKNSSHLAGCCFRQQNYHYHWPIKL